MSNGWKETVEKDKVEFLGYVEVFDAPEKSPYPDEQVYGYGYNIALLENENYGVLIENRKYDEYSASLYWLENEFKTKELAETFAENYVIEKYESIHKMTLDVLEKQDKKGR